MSSVLAGRGMRSARPLILALLSWAVVATAAPSLHAEPSRAGGAFQIDDYFHLTRVTELALSSDARWLAYVTESFSGEADARIRRVHLRALSESAAEVVPEQLSDAHSLAWIPNTHELAFLSARAGSSQLFSYDVATAEVRRRTRSAEGIERFLFAADGRTLAYTSRADSPPGTSLYEQFRHARHGILIDPATTSSHDFLNPNWQHMAKPPPAKLWVAGPGEEAVRVPVPGDPSGDEHAFFWSPDARFLSVTYVASDMPVSQLSDDRTSVGIFEPRSGSFRVLAAAVPPAGGAPGHSFKGGEWVPGRREVLLRRITETDPWVSWSYPDWTIAGAFADLPRKASQWHPLEVYPRGLAFLPLGASSILLANTVRGRHSLFTLKPDGIEPSGRVAGLDGSSSLFRFSGDFSDIVLVNESLTRPPEIYVGLDGAPVRQLTHLNDDVARSIRYRAREVSWKSIDGVSISGWLLEPAGARPEAGWPLITHVHGGPAFPFPDAFAAYFSYWPYPLEVYPAHSMAVFVPNYRGTHTYGRQIASATGNEQPMDDIITGVNALVASGVADATRLGISGHSHGAMLGPLTMARAKFFRAGSFAEGVANSVVMYELMSGDANREIHDPIVGASLYDSPRRYLAESPDLQFEGLSTASLFEAGSNTAALLMLGFPKAARRAGMPAEFVIYPRTGHNVTDARLQREAAQRNLDWFDFWLNGREDADPARAGQYRRWREMKARHAAVSAGYEERTFQ